MLGQSGAIARRAPHASTATYEDGATDPLAVVDATSVTSVSTGATTTLPSGIPIGGCWVTFVCDVDCYIHFASGLPSTGGNPSASASVSWPLFAGVAEHFWITDKEATFRVIRKSADGVLKRYRSNL
jgi:hypothetical protein